MNKTLNIVDTDYRTNIMVPYNHFQKMQEANERWEFIGKCQQVLPKEALHYPLLTLGLDEELREIFGYFVGGEEYSNLINASLDGETIEEKTQLINGLITGEGEDARQFWNKKKVQIGHLVNTARNHYNSVFEILERDYGYELKRVEVKMDEVERQRQLMEEHSESNDLRAILAYTEEEKKE